MTTLILTAILALTLGFATGVRWARRPRPVDVPWPWTPRRDLDSAEPYSSRPTVLLLDGDEWT